MRYTWYMFLNYFEVYDFAFLNVLKLLLRM